MAAVASVAGLGGVPGCRQRPPALDSYETLAPEDDTWKLQLTDGERAEVVSRFQALTAGQQRVNPPARAPYGVRWGDIPLALTEACDVEGVEMTVVRTVETDDEYRFEMRTIEDWPALLVVRRVDPPRIYEITECRVGRFPQEPEKVKRQEKLVRELRRYLERFGRQRWFNETP